MWVDLLKSLRRQILDSILYFYDSLNLALSSSTKIARNSSRKTAVFVRLDAIGDYVLWSSTFHDLQELYPKNEYDWVLIGNGAWRTLADSMGLFDQILTVSRNRLRKNPFYRNEMLNGFRSLPCDVVIHSTFSRDFAVADSIIRFLDAPLKVGFEGDLTNIPAWQRKISNGWYTELCAGTSDQTGELEWHAKFISHLKQKPVIIKTPDLASYFSLDKIPYDLPREPYFVLFPGASWAGKRWPLAHFFSVARKVQEKTGWLCVLCGSNDDHKFMEQELKAIESSLGSFRLKNLMSRTTQSELGLVLKGAKLLISNDTSAVHLGAAVKTPTVCVLGGGHFGRFVPWKDATGGFADNPACISVDMPCFGCGWNCIYPRGENTPVKCISDISVERVYDKALRVTGQDTR